MFTAIGILPALPALAALLTAILFLPRRSNGPVSAMLVVFASGANVVLSLMALQTLLTHGPAHMATTWIQIGSFSINTGAILDPLSATMMIVVSSVSFLVILYSMGYMQDDPGFARYFVFMGMFVAAMMGLVIADNLMLIYIFWELVGICSYLLIGFWFRKPSAANAAKKAFIVTRFGDLGLLLGIVFLGTAAKTFDLAAIRQLIESGTLQPLFWALPTFLTTVAILIFIGAAGKSAQFPLHVWLPDAMEGPTPVSALIHAATMVAAGVFLVARLYFLYEASPVALNVVAIVGGFTALMAATIALVQYDIKRVLAYSTISQLGYMMLGLGLGGVTVSIFHLGTHAFFKALLFLTAGSVIHATHETQDMRHLGGLHRKMPITSITTLIGALALAGIFPLSGFWSKDEILLNSMHKSPVLFGVGVLVAGLTAFYMFRLWFMTFGGTARTQNAEHAHESPAIMTLPLIILAILAVIAGAINLPGRETLAEFLTPSHTPPAFSIAVAAGSLAIALLGIGVAIGMYRRYTDADPVRKLPAPVYSLFANKWWWDDLYERGVARVSLLFAGIVAWVDRNVVDGMVNLTAAICGTLGSIFRLATSGQPQFYIAIIVLGAVAATWIFQLHDRPEALWVGVR